MFIDADKENTLFCGGCNRDPLASEQRLFSIAAVVGSILLIVGLWGLAGYFGAQTHWLLERSSGWLKSAACHLGTDPLKLALCMTAFGMGFLLSGATGLAVRQCGT